MRIVFIGTGEIGVPVLRALHSSNDHELVGAVTQPDKPAGRDLRMTQPPIKQAASGFNVPILQPERIKNSEWLFIEGYVIANPATGQGAVKRAVQLAKKHGVRIALTCSDAFIVNVFGDAFHETLKNVDLLFCNASEAAAIAGVEGVEEAFAKIRTMVPGAVITDGPNGAYYRYNGSEGHVPAFPCEPRDLTGAGDMFAGAFLYGITHGYQVEDATRGANYLAMKVINQIGARLHHDTQHEWQTGLASK